MAVALQCVKQLHQSKELLIFLPHDMHAASRQELLDIYLQPTALRRAQLRLKAFICRLASHLRLLPRHFAILEYCFQLLVILLKLL